MLPQPGEHGMAGEGDIRVQETTYRKFMAVFKWGAVACFIVAALVVYAITR
jgi:hypothetical protein